MSALAQHEHSGHNHAHGMAKKTLRLAFFLTLVILMAGLTGGILANSLALLSDAGHIVTDLFALGLAWFAAAQAERPSDERRTFGYHRVGILAAFLNAVLLIGIAIFICYEAIQRLQHPEVVQPLIMFGSAAIAIGINLFIAFGLQKDEHNLNVRAATLHVLSDIGASIGVVVAGIVILLTGWTIADPLLSVAIAVLVAFSAWRLMRETMDILLESTPRGICMADLVKDMKQVDGVRDVHDLHVWSITSEMNALSCHVMIDNLPPTASSPILNSLTAMLNSRYQIGHTTIQFECSTAHKTACCEGLYCRMEAPRGHQCEQNDGHSDKAQPAHTHTS
ncbi:MAG: cation transporter [Ktedonobacteraceae bacterium]|nr:cation transporter [Ktedonobacteraceae bacterium]MBV9615141.1 cation transporter [Ktedonobacteraceae bacterium]